MVIVKPKCYYDTQGKVHSNPLPYQVVDKRYPYNYFDTLDDVIHFRPRLSNQYEPDAPYCAFRKNAFVTENANMKNDLPPILGDRSQHKAIVFVDNADKDRIQARFIETCDKFAYLKVNLLKSDLDKYSDYNLHPHVITPCAPAVREWLGNKNKFNLRPMKNKKYDVCFVGDTGASKRREHRRRMYADLQKAARQLKLKALFKKRVPKGTYMATLNNTKMCHSLKGGGYRSRRDWEIMLANSVCLIDWLTQKDNVVIVDMEPEKHFLWIDKDMRSQLEWCMNNLDKLNEMRMAAYNRALECFIYGKLNLEERFIRLFLLKPQAVVNKYEDLVRQENELSLVNS
jgi:hypothetical protein